MFDEKEQPKVTVERLKRGDGTFVMVRFRNKTDLCEFADLIDVPHLKTLKKDTTYRFQWYKDSNKRNPLDQFFE